MSDNLNPPVELPDKLYFKIGEVSRLADVPTYVLRFWESEFPKIKPKRTNAGQRLYRKADVELVLTIKSLLHEKKFTIKGAKQFLQDQKSHKKITENNHNRNGEFLEEIRHRLQEIRTLLN